MRFIHLSDLHIGRQLHQYNLKEDQEHILGGSGGVCQNAETGCDRDRRGMCMISLYHLLRRWGFLTVF